MEEYLKTLRRTHFFLMAVSTVFIIFSISTIPPKLYRDAHADLQSFLQHTNDKSLIDYISDTVNSSVEARKFTNELNSWLALNGYIIDWQDDKNSLTPPIYHWPFSNVKNIGEIRLSEIRRFYEKKQALWGILPCINSAKPIFLKYITEINSNAKIKSGSKSYITDVYVPAVKKRLNVKFNTNQCVNNFAISGTVWRGEPGKGSGLVIQDYVSGTYINLQDDIVLSWLNNKAGGQELLMLREDGVRIFLPSANVIWSEIENMDLYHAMDYLSLKERGELGAVELLGIQLPPAIVYIGAPLVIFILTLYLYMVLNNTKYQLAQYDYFSIPWFPLYKDRLSLALTLCTIVVFPFIINVFIFYKYSGESIVENIVLVILIIFSLLLSSKVTTILIKINANKYSRLRE